MVVLVLGGMLAGAILASTVPRLCDLSRAEGSPHLRESPRLFVPPRHFAPAPWVHAMPSWTDACEPPYWIDGEGHKRFKIACLAGEADPAVFGQPGFVNVVSRPWTRVTENGRVLCVTTPCARIPLQPGAHTLTFENEERGAKRSETVIVTADKLKTVSVVLE
jgi:hypothetical protein